MSDILETLAGTLAKQGAPVLGGMIGTAIGGPAGAAIGRLAGKAPEALADAFGVPATPEAVSDAMQQPGAAATVATVEGRAKLMLPIWQSEVQCVNDAQAAEIEKGFGSWQWWRGAWQVLIIGGWATILLGGLWFVIAMQVGAAMISVTAQIQSTRQLAEAATAQVALATRGQGDSVTALNGSIQNIQRDQASDRVRLGLVEQLAAGNSRFIEQAQSFDAQWARHTRSLRPSS